MPFGKILKVLGYLRKIRYHLIELSFDNALLASILSSNLLLVYTDKESIVDILSGLIVHCRFSWEMQMFEGQDCEPK